ncbi:MAG: head GIN domain-containing protein [Anaerolineales bacterium]
MKQRKSLIILAVVLVFSILACDTSGIFVQNSLGTAERGSGNVVEETRPVSGVNGVDLATIGDVIIQLGDEESLRIEAEDNLMKFFETQVRGGILRISTNPKSVNLRPTKPVRFFLTVKELEEISISGSGDIQVPDLEADRFSVDIGGSGDVNMGNLNADSFSIDIGGSGDVRTERVKVPTFEVDINGSGDINLRELIAENLKLDVNGSGNLGIEDGQTGDQDIDINGSGNFQAGDMASKTAIIRIGGSGGITVWVTESLDVRINGSGNVRYYGRPSVSSSGNGSGDITSLGEK